MNDADFIEMSVDGSECTVRVSSDHLNCSVTARQVGQQVSQRLSEGDGDRVNIDLKQVDRIGSAGLNELIGINSHCRSLGIQLVLLDVQESVRNIFSLTRLERMFEFNTTVVSA